MLDPDTARSRTGYAISFLGCLVAWKSKLQAEIALSTCESEYIALSQALRTGIPIIHLVREMKEHHHHNTSSIPTIHCTLFEDNSGALTLAKAPAMRPRTKHINVKYHHFRSYVVAGAIDIRTIKSEDQPADILTKPLADRLFSVHRTSIMGWDTPVPSSISEQVPTNANAIRQANLGWTERGEEATITAMAVETYPERDGRSCLVHPKLS
jgi:hypothetical protein